MNKCKNCGKTLTQDEIAVYKRLVNRGAVKFLCIDCLAEYFKCDKILILQKIEQFKKMGCPLFDK